VCGGGEGVVRRGWLCVVRVRGAEGEGGVGGGGWWWGEQGVLGVWQSCCVGLHALVVPEATAATSSGYKHASRPAVTRNDNKHLLCCVVLCAVEHTVCCVSYL